MAFGEPEVRVLFPVPFVTVGLDDAEALNRRLLEETNESLESVCAMSGLGTLESMRRAFLHRVGVPPGQYRERFHAPPSPAVSRRTA